MKTLSDVFAARLRGGVVTLCLCWRLTRRDGVVVGVTDRDRAVTWQGLSYEPGAAIEAGSFEQTGGLAPGRGAGAGVLSSDTISEGDLEAGLWNGAEVAVYRVDWAHLEDGVLVWSGFLSELGHGASGFEAELVSRKAELERPVGRVFQRRCDARLGDARCGLSGVDGETCDKRFETCRDVYANSANFRGFPHMPGSDFVLAGPTASGNDGAKR